MTAPIDLPSLLTKCTAERDAATKQAAEHDARADDDTRPEWQRKHDAAMASFCRGQASGWECAAINVEHVIRGRA